MLREFQDEIMRLKQKLLEQERDMSNGNYVGTGEDMNDGDGETKVEIVEKVVYKEVITSTIYIYAQCSLCTDMSLPCPIF